MNATDLLNLRRNGKRPAGPVLATLVPEVNRFHPAIIVTRADDHTGFLDLDVFLAFATPQLETAIAIADALILARVSSLTLWALDTGRLVEVLKDGEKPLCLTLPAPGMVELVRTIKCK